MASEKQRQKEKVRVVATGLNNLLSFQTETLVPGQVTWLILVAD